MLVGFFTQLEFHVSLVNGVFSLTVHQRVSKQFYSAMATNSSLPLAHSVLFKETYENVKTALNVLKYDQYNWKVIGDFKMKAFLMGMQGGFTKYPCYLCLWDSRDTKASIKSKYARNVRNLLLEKKMSKIFH